MPSSPLLTIAIPTYNRCTYLSELLESLLSQLSKEGRVELIVSDNASTDQTSKVVQHYRDRGFEIQYLRNSANLGPDGNFIQCIKRASGRYVWIFGDDDILLPGSLAKILHCIESKHYDLIHLRSKPLTSEVATFVESNVASELDSTEFSDAIKFARCININFTFITANIFNNERLKSIQHPPFESLDGSRLVQLGWILTLLREHQRSLIINNPLIGSRVDNSGGYGLFEVFGKNLYHIVSDWILDPKLKRPILNSTLQIFFPVYILRLKIQQNSCFTKENPHFILGPLFHWNFRYWVFNYPLIVLPLPLGKIWFLGIRIINRIDRIFGNPLIK